MTDRDAFEVRFAAAVRGYAGRVSSDLDPVEFARRVVAKEPRRHGLAAALTWRGLAIPRVAWVLLLLAALLLAVVAGILVAGSPPAPKLPAVVPPVGQPFACPPGSTPDTPGPVDQARPPVGADLVMAFDRRAGRLVALANAREGIQTWTLDVCTNTWTRMYPNQEPWWIDWGPLIYDIDSDATVLIAKGTVWAFDLQANTWNPKRATPTGNTAPWAYDPLSGLIVATDYDDAANLWNYDVDTDTWTPIHQTNLPGDGSPPYAVYDASVDRIMTYGAWRLDIRTGTWSTSGTETPRVVAGYGWQAPRIEYDEAAKRMVVFGNGQLAVYDATADRWEVLIEADIGGSLPLSMVYDPVNRRLVGLWGSTAVQDGVVAFDLAARERTLLLEPSDVRPAPSSESSIGPGP